MARDLGPDLPRSTAHVRARFVIVGMVEQAGTGATAAGPMLKRDLGRDLSVLNGKKPIITGRAPGARSCRKIAPQVKVVRR